MTFRDALPLSRRAEVPHYNGYTDNDDLFNIAEYSNNIFAMASSSAASTSTVKAQGVQFEMMPASPSSKPVSVARKLSKRRMRSSTAPEKRIHSLLPTFVSRDTPSSSSATHVSHIQPGRPVSSQPAHHRERPPMLRRASSDPDLQAMPNSYFDHSRPSAPDVHSSFLHAPHSTAFDEPVFASTPPRNLRRPRTPTSTCDSPSFDSPHSFASNSFVTRSSSSANGATPQRKMPPRLASRPAQLNLASPKLIQPASAVKPSNDSTASLSVQMHGAIGQRESAEVNVDGDGAMLILDSNAPLTVEYQTVVIPGSTAKRWILRFKRADGDPTPLSPPSKATARVQFPVVGASSPSRQTQRDAFFWQSPSTPTDSRQMSTPQLSRLSGRKSISPERFEESCDSDSDEGSVVSSPPPATPRPLVYNVSTSTPSIKQTGEFQLRPMFPDFGPLSPKQIQRNGRSEAEEQPISPLQLNRHRHVRISSQDTVLGCRSPDEDYYGDVLGIFMGQLEDEDEVSDKQQVKVHPTASLAQRRGLKGSALKLPELAKREDGVEQSHWSETESDDNDLNNDSDS